MRSKTSRPLKQLQILFGISHKRVILYENVNARLYVGHSLQDPELLDSGKTMKNGPLKAYHCRCICSDSEYMSIRRSFTDQISTHITLHLV